MTLDQILDLITPIVSGFGGIVMAALVFINRIRSLTSTVKAQLTDNNTIKKELEETRKALNDLNQKITFVVEEAKHNAKKE